MLNDNSLIVISGPTAAGKTDISIELAKRINGEIISADSMQVYKGMDIGTAKIKQDEMQGVKHYMIDVLTPYDEFNVYIFKKMVNECINTIREKKKVPILVGGTGFYIQAVIKDVDFSDNPMGEEESNNYRIKLESLAKEKGGEYLHEMLKKTDPESARQIHKNNIKRIIRALLYYKETGQKISLHNESQKEKKNVFDVSYFVITKDRNILYEQINKRVDLMRKEGLLDEVIYLIKQGLKPSMTSVKGIGYREFFENEWFMNEFVNSVDYPLNSKLSDNDIKKLDEIFEKIKLDTRHFAKRQITWFKREENVIYIDRSTEAFNSKEKIIDFILTTIEKSNV